MAAFFTIGEKKTRPGVYYRYENYGGPVLQGADDGKCAAVFRSDWGPLGKSVPLEKYEDAVKAYGQGGDNSRTAVVLQQFRGGARLVMAVRAGTGGDCGAYEIKDGTDTAVIRLTMKYPGSRLFHLTIRQSAEVSGSLEMLLLDGTLALEKFTFDEGAASQTDALIKAVEDKGSDYFTLIKLADSSEALSVIDQEAVAGGSDPVVDAAAYSAAFEALESCRWNVLSIDTNEPSIHMMMQLYLNRVYREGKFVMGVVGEDKSVPFETRLTRASAYNDYQLVYVGTGFVDSAGGEIDGWKAAARIAGIIAGTPSNKSITHLGVSGAVSLTEPLTNFQYETAIKAGVLTFSVSPSNTVWVEQGINTLVLPDADDDDGWKKIKRAKIRFEMMQRIADTIDGLVGQVNNDPDGRMTIIQTVNGVLGAMTAEKKLLSGGRCELDPDNPPEGDSAWFLIYADDIDSMEKMYFVYKFRFAPGKDE